MKNDTKSNSIWTIISGLFSLFVSGVIGLAIPMILEVQEYSLYQTYQLYIIFGGLFHFGFINGVYLKYGDKDYNNLPYSIFRGFTKYLIYLQIIVQIILITIVMIFVVSDKKLVFVYLAINIGLVNISCYFSLITQFTKRFVIDGKIQLVSSFVLIGMYFVAFCMGINTYVYFLDIITIGNIFLLIMYLINNIDVVFGRKVIIKNEIVECHSRGIFVNLSEVIGIVIVNIDSVFINILCDKEVFAMYSFAIGVVLLYYRFVGVTSKLFFPYFKRVNQKSLISVYNIMTNIVQCTVLLLLCTVSVFQVVANYFLPNYTESFIYVYVLIVTVVFKSHIDLLCNTIYKVLDSEKKFFKNNLFAMIVVVFTNVFAWMFFHKAMAIAWASFASYLIWYMVTDAGVRKLLEMKEFQIKTKAFLLFDICLFFMGAFKWNNFLPYFMVSIIYFIFCVKKYQKGLMNIFI